VFDSVLSDTLAAYQDVSRCPSEDMLARYGDRLLDTISHATLEAHLVQCESCDLAAAMFRGSHAASLQLSFATGGQADLTSFVQRTKLARSLVPGAQLGRFRLLNRVGIGAMGVVFAAHDPELDRNVALKVLLETSDSPARERDRVAREARSMAKLAHPNVVTVYEIGVAEDRVFLAMELVVGSTLQEWLALKPPQAAILSVFQRVTEAVEAGHRAGIVHRDLKPQNILMTHEGHPKVTDFGLAEAATSSETEGLLVGTPAYMSLEAMRGAPAGPATDQFALAVCLHEALTGKRPYEANSIEEMRRILEAKPVVDRSIPAPIRAALERALDPSPALRFGSVADFGVAFGIPRKSAFRKRTAFAGMALTGLAVASVSAFASARRVAAPSLSPSAGANAIVAESTTPRVAASVNRSPEPEVVLFSSLPSSAPATASMQVKAKSASSVPSRAVPPQPLPIETAKVETANAPADTAWTRSRR
jgi:eukaryotic-like serine/threonine-protein kinase